jgi:hypothetical protein
MLDGLDKALTSVTKEWKAEKRQADRQDRLSRQRLTWLARDPRAAQWSIKQAAYEVMEQAYNKASGGGQYSANARQIMYAARPLVLKLTDGKCWKNSAYFTQHLLPGFMEENPDICRSWDVVFDARGHLREPHTRYELGLGTLEVRRYLSGWTDFVSEEAPGYHPGYDVDTRGPGNRYQFALFIEKEGFNELIEQANIAERFDLAVMSTKGMSVTASRTLVEALTDAGVTTLVARDFDKAGFSIVHTLSSDTRRYRFAGAPDVVDLGLRLEDVEAMGLDSEPVDCGEEAADNLDQNGATPEEIDFLTNGERVELNAMTSPQFVEWLETKLEEVGVEKVVPEEGVLARAYRRAIRLARAEKAANEALAKLTNDEVAVPADLRERVEERLAEYDGDAWDDVVAELARRNGGSA